MKVVHIHPAPHGYQVEGVKGADTSLDLAIKYAYYQVEGVKGADTSLDLAIKYAYWMIEQAKEDGEIRIYTDSGSLEEKIPAPYHPPGEWTYLPPLNFKQILES